MMRSSFIVRMASAFAIRVVFIRLRASAMTSRTCFSCSSSVWLNPAGGSERLEGVSDRLSGNVNRTFLPNQPHTSHIDHLVNPRKPTKDRRVSSLRRELLDDGSIGGGVVDRLTVDYYRWSLRGIDVS